MSKSVLLKQTSVTASGARDVATFAAGCFWGIELAYQRVPGIIYAVFDKVIFAF